MEAVLDKPKAPRGKHYGALLGALVLASIEATKKFAEQFPKKVVLPKRKLSKRAAAIEAVVNGPGHNKFGCYTEPLVKILALLTGEDIRAKGPDQEDRHIGTWYPLSAIHVVNDYNGYAAGEVVIVTQHNRTAPLLRLSGVSDKTLSTSSSAIQPATEAEIRAFFKNLPDGAGWALANHLAPKAVL